MNINQMVTGRLSSGSALRKGAVLMVALLAMGAYGKAVDSGKRHEAKPVEPDAGMFLAPLHDAFDPTVGSLEIQFSLDYSFGDYLRPETSGCIPFYFLRFCSPDGDDYGAKTDPGFALTLGHSRGNNSIGFGQKYYYLQPNVNPEAFGAGGQVSGVAVPGNQETGPWFLRGEWHSLAVTWKVENGAFSFDVYVDGKFKSRGLLPSKRSNVGTLTKNDLLSIGGLNLSPVTILSYRISNRVRTKEEIALDKPLAVDEATTFFLNGESAEKIRIMDAKDYQAKLKNKSLFKQAVFIGNIKIVITPKGKAIQFYKKCSR